VILLAASLTAAWTFAAGVGLLAAILLRRSYRVLGKARRRGSESPIDLQPRPLHAWAGAYTDSSALIERQRVELHEQGRDLKAQLDNKLVILQALCAKSQRQIDRMEELLAEMKQREQSPHA